MGAGHAMVRRAQEGRGARGVQGKAWVRAQESWAEAPSDGDPVIAVIDDHRLVASLLVTMLTSAGYIAVDAYRESPAAIVEELGRIRPHLTFIDHDLGPAGYGVGLVEAARRHGVVVALTASDDRLLHAGYLEAGAGGVVPKTSGPTDILATVELALAGEPITTEVARQQLLMDLRMARSLRSRALRPFELLTQREQEALRALCKGEVAATIAEDWVVSMATVRSHIRSILTKLGVSSQIEAVAMAHSSGWVRPVDGESPILMMTHVDDGSTMGTSERKSVG